MARYEKYKDSGEQWLGQVPDHWDIIKGRGVFGENREKNDGTSDASVLSLSYGKIILKKDIDVGLVPADYKGYQIIKPDYIIIRCTDLQNDKVSLRTGISKHFGMITSAYLGLIVKPGFNPDYMHYYLHTWDISKEIYRHGGGLRQVLSWNDIKYLSVLIPPKREQDRIVEYLDDACADIDKAITQQQRMIDLLNERKQIIIQNAVTKGLDPNVPMKDSGIDYIGEIPTSWKTKKIKYLASYNDDSLSETTKKDCEIDYVEISDVHFGQGITNSTKYVFDEVSSRARRITRKGDIIISTVRTYLKAVAVVNKDGLIVSTGFMVIRPNLDMVDGRFMSYAVLASSLINEVEKISVGTSYPAVNAWQVADLKIAYPKSKDEQKRIANFLLKVEGDVENAIKRHSAIIELLKERKRIIINDVVTGKNKVS